MSYDKLRAAGASVEFEAFEGMGHAACPEELSKAVKFWERCIGSAKP